MRQNLKYPEKKLNKLKNEKILGMKKYHRNYEIKVRLSKWEKEKIIEKAKVIGIKPSQYVRVVALHGLRVPEMIIL